MENIRPTPRKEIHLRDYLVVLDKYKWLIVAAILVTTSATVFHLKRQEPIYRAQASMIIEPNQRTQTFSGQSMQFVSTDWLDLGTQIETIKTTPILTAVVRRLNLSIALDDSVEFYKDVEELKKNIGINLVNDTKLVTITAKHTVPETAQAIANTLAETYIEQDRMSRLQAGRDAVKWLSVQLADLKKKLRDSEEAFQTFKEQEGIVTLEDSRSEDMVERSEFSTSYITARSSRLEIEAIIDELGNEDGAEAEIPIALLNSPTLQELGKQLSLFQTELAEKRKIFKETFPDVINLKDRIQLTQRNVMTELRRQRDFLKAQEDSFLTQQNAGRSAAISLSKRELEYMSLEREVSTNREMYNALLRKVSELSLAGDTDLNNIRIVEPAKLPLAPSSNRALTLALGAFLGAFLGVGFAFFLKYLENTIGTPDDIEQHLELPVLGVVPEIKEAKVSKYPILMLQQSPKSAPSEAYRSIRTNILLSRFSASDPEGIEAGSLSRKSVVLVVTSTGPKEGKSITAANLAMAMAQAGQKVLLVDADLRRPMQHRVFDMERSRGLSSVLAGELTLDEVIIETDVPNLSVILSGSVPENPSEILGSVQMNELIEDVRERYDIVLFDSAPILGMTDTAVLASEADGVVMVIKAGQAPRKALQMAMAQLGKVGAHILGTILNDVDVRRDRYYDYYYYYYYSPYEDDEEKKVRKRRARSKERRAKGIKHSI